MELPRYKKEYLIKSLADLLQSQGNMRINVMILRAKVPIVKLWDRKTYGQQDQTNKRGGEVWRGGEVERWRGREVERWGEVERWRGGEVERWRERYTRAHTDTHRHTQTHADTHRHS